MDSEADDNRWYRQPGKPHPFYLSRKIAATSNTRFRSLASFPWTLDSFSLLFDLNETEDHDIVTLWKDSCAPLSDALAVGGDSSFYVFYSERHKQPISIKLKGNNFTPIATDCVHVAWAIRSSYKTYKPVLVVAYLGLIYIYDVMKNQFLNCLRGHGGAITSIAVHPRFPNIFCTTSRDLTTRVYNLNLEPQRGEPNNPHCPPAPWQSRAGPAHGLEMSEPEGMGSVGRCVVVLMGARSGGHQAEVLAAAFHPVYPLLATCGMDRAVKIWHLFPPYLENPVLVREDKPLFSSSMIHRARIMSVNWIQHDILLTHSAPAVMQSQTEGSNPKNIYLESGCVILWRWLGIDRFFPAVYDPLGGQGVRQAVLHGCASDYQESASFKLISTASLPVQASQYHVPQLQVFLNQDHDPLVILTYPNGESTTLFNLVHLTPRKPLPFPHDAEDVAGKMANTLRVTDEVTVADSSRQLPPGWTIQPDTTHTPEEKLEGCIMGPDMTLFGVGSRGTVWVWKTKIET